MKVIATSISEVVLIEPTVHRDDRGLLLETWSERRYREAGIAGALVQFNHSVSAARTLRGLHAQWTRPQGKLVRVLEGAIYDVAVDIRPDSPTFRRWVGVELTADSFRQFWVPPGFAHGFAVLGERAQVEYGCSDYYARGDEIAIAWNDPELAIGWPFDDPVLSPRDAAAAPLARVLEGLR